ncbi:MAG: efflux RND transporter periplasmic adaptor subunit [Gammaproteobacteria bacterium]|nr:efflux RND transporter periplasmic adaptor subunit [Gammaproteobacteria bacterium]MDH5240249.1 efflux RND transporter periplasmic adaptor subunit [Gammaproteobacteria bacterium]MDH5260173.1 efflux RND transporter periplasmic adaptor subunit [Gammaproteobacteria bacterium]MDH5583318.1 efflux RND transporter periplasmic adaptor subunit [Gammaproteobacteria bacterium]
MRYSLWALFGLVPALIVGCSQVEQPSSGGNRSVAIKVITAEIELRSMVDEIQALGTASANESIDIQPRIASRLERVAFDEGQFVKKGDLLVELENSEIVAGLALAEAALSESRSIYNRSKSLATTQAISASNLDQLLAQVQVNEAQVEAAQARLANTIIRAPFSGRIGLRRVSPGSLVNTQTVITTLDDTDTIKLDFSVPETFLTVVRKGMAISAESIVYSGRTFDGEVVSIDTRVDPVSRAVKVRSVIPNPDSALKPGMFLTVALRRDQGEVLVVPEQAIVPEGSNQYVFVAQAGVVEKRKIAIGRRIPGFVVVTGGVSEGERVVTEGSAKVREGSVIEDLGNADI